MENTQYNVMYPPVFSFFFKIKMQREVDLNERNQLLRNNISLTKILFLKSETIFSVVTCLNVATFLPQSNK